MSNPVVVITAGGVIVFYMIVIGVIVWRLSKIAPKYLAKALLAAAVVIGTLPPVLYALAGLVGGS